jgi:hypothetical protein
MFGMTNNDNRIQITFLKQQLILFKKNLSPLVQAALKSLRPAQSRALS